MSESTKKEYFLGLDIGTDSVGWAVTDSEYHILRRKGKALWGLRLFDAANTAAERRTFRTNRRRIQRRKQRIRLLQQLFAEEIAKIDPRFFQRMSDSAFWQEDKHEQQIYSLFSRYPLGDKNVFVGPTKYTDVEYYKEYPTIYHLRSALIKEKKQFDLRLVYLAIHHLMKHRGHFLFNGSINNVTSFHMTFQTFTDCLSDELGIELECDSEDGFAEILKDKHSKKTAKCSDLERLCHVEKADKQLKEIFKLITGMKANLSVVFSNDELAELEHNKISFSESSYDEIRLALEDEIQELTGVLDILHAVYSWAILADILDGGEYEGNSYLSVAKVNSYQKHGEDLRLLKSLIRECCPEDYKAFFSSAGHDNYCAYVGSLKKNGKKHQIKWCSQEDFYKSLKKLLNRIPSERLEAKDILLEIENGTFLPLQVSKDNGVIPYQVNKIELEKILQNAEKYFPFLKNVDDECGKTVSEKIMSLFEFRIPYYVGPLNTASGENCWMVRKEEGKIYPWNFEKKVDSDRSAEEFIRRMTNQCTYLFHEEVVPKNSLLYSEFMVLNELNNVKIRAEKLPVELKKEIVRNLFMRHKQVTGKKLLNYLKANGYDVKKEELSGFDGNFKASMSSYITLKDKVFGEELEKHSVLKMAEDIILWITLYGEDQKMLRRVIKGHYGQQLSEKQIDALVKLKFQGWGRLSRRFLSELEGVERETGECFTIIQGLRNTQNNLMQLLSQQFTFMEMIEEENGSYHVDEITYDSLVKDMVISPSVKRAVWQTVQIVEEIREIMGGQPEKIFVEMARSDEEKKRTISRRDKLIEAYSAIKDEAHQWQEELQKYSDGDFKAIKLYLYYTQMGQCMYTGKKIDLSQLNDANIWDRDHIYPQSKTKDDSLDNLVLVDRRVNAKKSDGMLSPEIQQTMGATWKYLKEKKLISEKKYERLTRTAPLSDEELAGFINRQLVETRQSSKAVATLLKRVYGEVEIVYVKAEAVSNFRAAQNRCKTLNYVKVRDLNDYHHAKDAYQNIVVGNVYHEKFTSNPLRWLKDNPSAEYSLNRMFNYDLKKDGKIIWKSGKNGSIKNVADTLLRNDILFTRYAFCNKGGLFNQKLVAAPEDQKKAKGLVPIKRGMDTWKYGGYSSVTPSHFMLVASEDKKGKEIRTIETVPLCRRKEFEKNPGELLQYCEEFYGLKNPRVIIPCIKKNARLIVNGFPMHLKGSTGKQLILQGAVQLCLDTDRAVYLKKVTKYLEENAQRRDKKSLLEIRAFSGINAEDNIELYDLFIDKLSHTIYQYRPTNPKDILIKGRPKFMKLDLAEQCIVLGEVLHLFQCRPLGADLTLIEASPHTGEIKVGKKISNCKSVKLASQSVTGIWEQVIDLLHI
ncbi:MAG: type II CRISPR RNA-guided endonuclease Cas9 [Dorea sp.]|jgi:CRISPR-associated endonuclease Csn1|nr:type II CRISPR RNA-guided endonuclease Cas9 [Dorea sp.]